MEVRVNRNGHSACLEISGKINESGAKILDNRYREMGGNADLKELVLDFKNVSEISRSGIGQLIIIYKEIAVSGGVVRIESASEEIHNLLTGLDFEKIMEISKK